MRDEDSVVFRGMVAGMFAAAFITCVVLALVDLLPAMHTYHAPIDIDEVIEIDVEMGEPVVTTVWVPPTSAPHHPMEPIPARGGCLTSDDCRHGTCIGRVCQDIAAMWGGLPR